MVWHQWKCWYVVWHCRRRLILSIRFWGKKWMCENELSRRVGSLYRFICTIHKSSVVKCINVIFWNGMWTTCLCLSIKLAHRMFEHLKWNSIFFDRVFACIPTSHLCYFQMLHYLTKNMFNRNCFPLATTITTHNVIYTTHKQKERITFKNSAPTIM